MARPSNVVKLPSRPLARETMQDRAYRALHNMILNGDISPGQTLSIQSLARSFQVSAMPIREALRRLTAERALMVLAGRSVGVPTLTREHLADLRRVRREIEGLAISWAAERMSARDLKRMAVLITRMQSAADQRDGCLYVPANHDFHFIAYQASGSPVLLRIIDSLWLQIGPYFHMLRTSKNWQSANAVHQDILDALSRRDGAAAAAALRSDIDAAARALEAVLPR